MFKVEGEGQRIQMYVKFSTSCVLLNRDTKNQGAKETNEHVYNDY